MKQTFKIPEGVKEVKVDQVDGKIVIEFVPEKYKPQVGEIIKSFIYEEDDSEYVIAIFSGEYGNCVSTGLNVGRNLLIDGIGIQDDDLIQPASESDKQLLLSALAKEGYTWNAETKQIEKKRWRGGRRW